MGRKAKARRGAAVAEGARPLLRGTCTQFIRIMSLSLSDVESRLAEAQSHVKRLEKEREHLVQATAGWRLAHHINATSATGRDGGYDRLALCVTGQMRGILPRLPVWSHLVRRNLVIPSGASHVDTFLALSEVQDNHKLEEVRSALKAVAAIGSPTSDCTAPLLAPLCAAKGYQGRPPRAKAQFFWVEQCLDAVMTHEKVVGRAYDWTLRLRAGRARVSP